MNSVTIKLDTINKILNYLSKRPYEEVIEIISTVYGEVQEQTKSNQQITNNQTTN